MPPDTVIAASGGLGFGKTVFAQGLAQGMGIGGPVVSPTYIYIQEYAGRLPFCHIDAYRMEQLEEEEIAQLGLSECFLPGKTAYVEWPQFIQPFLPQDTIILQFTAPPQQPETRRLLFSFEEKAQAWLAPLLKGFLCVF
jgi:tRNA threonylcarbamoyladenosine biosynthesis protein TsaE